jgi:hypothetical protein
LDMPPARSLSTSRILRMGNLCPGMPCSPQRSRGNADSKITQRRWSHPSTAWSRSPGMGGRDQSERPVAINWNRWSQSAGTRSVRLAHGQGDRFIIEAVGVKRLWRASMKSGATSPRGRIRRANSSRSVELTYAAAYATS